MNAQGATHSTPHQVPLIGVIPGEGIGPEVMAAALDVLDAVVSPSNRKVETYETGPIGREAERLFDTCLPREAINFCEGVFERGGAILHGPGGGRFVYDFRRQFDLFIKITPLRNSYAAPGASSVKPHLTQNIDVLVTRENLGGIYLLLTSGKLIAVNSDVDLPSVSSLGEGGVAYAGSRVPASFGSGP